MEAMLKSLRGFNLFCYSVCLMLPLLVVPSVMAASVSGVELKESIKLGSNHLHLNGAGQRSMLLIDLYVASLYLTNKTADPQAIINANEAMLIH